MRAEADRVHAVVARCLTDPAYLGDALAASGEAAQDHEAALTLGRELERVALFQGFITKVKHNRLRSVLPFTLQVLASLGEELAFFADYSPAYAAMRAAGPVSLAEHCEHLGRHLQAYLESRSIAHGALVSSVYAHETTMRLLAGPDAEASAPADADLDAVRWSGRLILRRYRADVLAACAALQERTIDPKGDAFRRAATIAYWRGVGEGAVKALDVDEATGLMLSLVDGRRTYGQIAAAFSAAVGTETDAGEVRLFFREVEACGIRADTRSAA